jgi:hypothetical protein
MKQAIGLNAGIEATIDLTGKKLAIGLTTGIEL